VKSLSIYLCCSLFFPLCCSIIIVSIVPYHKIHCLYTFYSSRRTSSPVFLSPICVFSFYLKASLRSLQQRWWQYDTLQKSTGQGSPPPHGNNILFPKINLMNHCCKLGIISSMEMFYLEHYIFFLLSFFFFCFHHLSLFLFPFSFLFSLFSPIYSRNQLSVFYLFFSLVEKAKSIKALKRFFFLTSFFKLSHPCCLHAHSFQH
jgi:hypothetical protein